MLAVIDWTTVIVALIAAVPSTVAAFAAITIRNQIRTPSGSHIGEVAERTHALAAVNAAAVANTAADVKAIRENGNADAEHAA